MAVAISIPLCLPGSFQEEGWMAGLGSSAQRSVKLIPAGPLRACLESEAAVLVRALSRAGSGIAGTQGGWPLEAEFW